MKLLALECSTPRAGAALFADGSFLGERTWRVDKRQGEELLQQVQGLLDEHGTTAGELTHYAVGRGPGNYSGMRAALTTVQALALPGGCSVHAISSGIVLAGQVAREEDLTKVVVLGDARRSRLWAGTFEVDDGEPTLRGEWSLVEPAEAGHLLEDGARAVSSEWSKLHLLPFAKDLPAGSWVARDLFPSAQHLGQLATAHIIAHKPSEPLSPLYLHPAV